MTILEIITGAPESKSDDIIDISGDEEESEKANKQERDCKNATDEWQGEDESRCLNSNIMKASVTGIQRRGYHENVRRFRLSSVQK